MLPDCAACADDGGADCGLPAGGDPNLRYCLDTTLAWMLNSTTVWQGAKRLHFFISFIHLAWPDKTPNTLVGKGGDAKWAGLVHTFVAAMKSPRYLRVNRRPVFKILSPDGFLAQCGSNATLATIRLTQLREAAIRAGLQEPTIGGGWHLPMRRSAPPVYAGAHPQGYIQFNRTKVGCPGGCVIKATAVSSLVACQLLCNSTLGCAAITVDLLTTRCQLLSQSAPGAADAMHDTYVRVPDTVQYDWTGTYNAAVPYCPPKPPSTSWVCPAYVNSWMPNRTANGGEVFPYRECGDYQGASRTNHSHDPVPYLANVIAGFDPRPWEEQEPSFAMPTQVEWAAVPSACRCQMITETMSLKFSETTGIYHTIENCFSAPMQVLIFINDLWRSRY